MSGPVFRGRRFRLVTTRANGQPAFGCYLVGSEPSAPGAHMLLGLVLAGDRIAAITTFLDGSLPPRFELPRALPR